MSKLKYFKKNKRPYKDKDGWTCLPRNVKRKGNVYSVTYFGNGNPHQDIYLGFTPSNAVVKKIGDNKYQLLTVREK